jgi:hypothetical protein
MMVCLDLVMCADLVNTSRNVRILGIFGFGLMVLPPRPTQRSLLFDLLHAAIVGTFNFLSPDLVKHRN